MYYWICLSKGSLAAVITNVNHTQILEGINKHTGEHPVSFLTNSSNVSFAIDESSTPLDSTSVVGLISSPEPQLNTGLASTIYDTNSLDTTLTNRHLKCPEKLVY